MRLTHLVNYDCLLLQVDTKYWLEQVEKRINCIQQNAQQGNLSLWNIDHFVSTAKFCINVVSVKYNEKNSGNREISEPAHESKLTKAYLHFMEITVFSIIISRLFEGLVCRRKPRKMAGGEFNSTEFKSLSVQKLTQSTSLTVESLKELWAKEFLPNIRKEIRKEIDSLKASLLDLKKRFDEIEKSQSFISKKYDTVISAIKDVGEHNEGVKSQIKEIKSRNNRYSDRT